MSIILAKSVEQMISDPLPNVINFQGGALDYNTPFWWLRLMDINGSTKPLFSSPHPELMFIFENLWLVTIISLRKIYWLILLIYHFISSYEAVNSDKKTSITRYINLSSWITSKLKENYVTFMKNKCNSCMKI